mgnify:FL=1
MVYLIDNFVEQYLFKALQDKLNSSNYVEHKTPNKSFWVQPATDLFIEYVISLLEKKENKKLENILAFFRVSNEQVDTDWRIHSDLIIEDQKPDRALVLYISPKKIKELHGTALWEHKTYGKSLPDSVTNEEYDRMITKESENLDMWTLSSVLGYEENRAISYPANYFHSKYPNKSWEEGRQVFVMFYKIK